MEYSITARQNSCPDRHILAEYGLSFISPSLSTTNSTSLLKMLAAIGETFDPALSEITTPMSDGDTTASPPRSIITGVLCSARPTFYRISIWTRLAASPNSPQDPPPGPATPPSEQGEALIKRIEAIGRHFKHFVLGYAKGTNLAGGMSTEVEFISHKDSERKPKGANKKFIII